VINQEPAQGNQYHSNILAKLCGFKFWFANYYNKFARLN